MKTVWKWVLGILAVLVVLGVLAVAPLIWHQFLPYGGYGMAHGYWQAGRMPMHNGYGWSSPMMGGGYGLGFGSLFGGLIQLGLLALIVLGIVWLVRAIGNQNQNHQKNS